MAGAEVFVFLLVAVAVLAGLGLRLQVPYPVVLVVGGLAIGLAPGLPDPELEPDVVFFAFLPSLLCAAAFQAPADELRANAGLESTTCCARSRRRSTPTRRARSRER